MFGKVLLPALGLSLVASAAPPLAKAARVSGQAANTVTIAVE